MNFHVQIPILTDVSLINLNINLKAGFASVELAVSEVVYHYKIPIDATSSPQSIFEAVVEKLKRELEPKPEHAERT